MTVRWLDMNHDYGLLQEWWGRRGLTAPSKIILEGGHGFCMTVEGVDVVAAFIYLSDKGLIGIVEWALANPQVKDATMKKEAMERLYDFMEKFAKERGCLVLFTSTQAEGSLVRLLHEMKWTDCPGSPHIHLLKEIP